MHYICTVCTGYWSGEGLAAQLIDLYINQEYKRVLVAIRVSSATRIIRIQFFSNQFYWGSRKQVPSLVV